MSSDDPVSGPAAEQCTIAAGASGVAEGALAIGPFTGALFALAGGAIVWALVQAVDPVFTLPKELANLPTPAPVHLLNAQAESGKRANLYNTVLMMGVFGGLAGAALAVAEGWLRRSWRMALVGGAACAAVGLVSGCLAALLAHVVEEYYAPDPNLVDLAKTTIVQAVMLATLGACLGLGVGMLARRGKTVATCLLGGLLGGCLAGILYPILVALLAPAADTENVVPRGPVNRLLWMSVTAGLLGLTIPGITLRRRPARNAAPGPTPPAG